MQFGHWFIYFGCTQLWCLDERFDKLLSVTNNYLLVMIIDRGKDICFCHFVIVNVHSTLSAGSVGVLMNSSS